MFGKVKTGQSTAAAGPDSSPSECNVVLLGMMGCGKSALTVKFLTKRFIKDVYSSEQVVDQQLVTVRVMDTCDQEGPVNSERYLSWGSVFLVVYSIDSMESFKRCQLYLHMLSLHQKSPIILLGNKLDMDPYRQVSRSEAESVASCHGCVFLEVSSCLDYLAVQHVFFEAVRRARRGRSYLVPAVCVSEDRAALPPPSFTTPCFKELPAPATAKLVTVKTSRAQSKRRATTLTLLKGFKIF
ncbi:ras-like protein family member 12 isoform X2 [Notolabrus celidotus]|uniref:ras-like protein family member 12 isoform X2 n=1 Tax=Notolabrus celidotus TaxID=1203425 RepID=UPI001490196B|nr:ras-like protein family member 12 isoform X2 [Notolabrus celidotus]